MAEVIRMPRLSDTMEEGVIIEWLKKVGDQVSPGDILAEVETDKATMDLESFSEGFLLHIEVAKGSVLVDGIIAVIGKPDEDVAAILANESSAKASESATMTPPTPIPQVEQQPRIDTGVNERQKASPLAKKMATQAGIDLNRIVGSGENQRIIKRDVEEAIQRKAAPTSGSISLTKEGSEDVALSQMRKTIARRLGESKFSAPHFYLTMKIDMTEAIKSRKQINAMIAPSKISFNDLIIKASAAALKQHPEVNSSWMGDHIRRNFDVHIGVAVAIDDGLIVPVIPHADQKGLSQISEEVKDKANRARNRKLELNEMQGNTFTISNLGMFGIDEFTAIINPPDGCILAVGSIQATPVVVTEQVVVRSIMKVTLSCDHRVVDGALGSRFLQTVKSFLEAPVRLLA